MFSWQQRIVVAFAGAELYDIVVFASLTAFITANYFPESAFGQNSALLTALLFGVRYVSRPLGGLVLGCLSDAWSRKQTLVLSSCLSGIATLSMIALPTYHDLGMMATIAFVVLQLVQAFFLVAKANYDCIYAETP